MTRRARRCARVAVPRLAAVMATFGITFALTPEQKQLNIESFEHVWKTVGDKHWQTPPAGLDWQAIHDELRPKIEKADSMAAAREVMNDMLGRLHQTHFGVIPAEVYSDVKENGAAGGSAEGSTGLDVRLIGSQVLVTSVEAGSSAASQGVKRGWEIRKIDGQDVAPVVAKLEQSYGKSSMRDVVERRAILSRLAGGIGQTVSVEFLDGASQHVTKMLVRAKPKGELVQFGYLYPSYVWLDSSRIGAGDIGYVSFNLFLDPTRLMSLFGQAVGSCNHCAGFIIDLRGNPGGLGAMAMGIAGWFIDAPDQRLGTLYLRNTTLKFTLNPRKDVYKGPLAILVDGASASTSEILAEGLKDLGRAEVFGTRTAAAALPSVFEMLPNGDGFQYAIANYISEGGKPLEGLGVIPDIEAPLTRQALLAGRDPALDAAIEWIKSK